MLPIVSPLPCVWNNTSVLWLAPTLLEAIEASGDKDGWIVNRSPTQCSHLWKASTMPRAMHSMAGKHFMSE